MNRKLRIVLAILAVAALVVTGAVLRAQGASQVRACATCAPPSKIDRLPSTQREPTGPLSVVEALEVLSFDDGTCESGLGAGVLVTDYVEFDVPPSFGLSVVALTTRMNTGVGTAFALGQGGATPPGAGAGQFVVIPAIPSFGPCPATALTQRSLPTGVTITGTSNFFAGLRTPTGFAGRDTNGPPAGRIWLNCASCGMTQYSPTTLSSLELGGNWMIRVTVETSIPVELIGFDVS